MNMHIGKSYLLHLQASEQAQLTSRTIKAASEVKLHAPPHDHNDHFSITKYAKCYVDS